MDPLFHGDLILNKDHYETTKRFVMEEMQRIDSIPPDYSFHSSEMKTNSSSLRSNDRMLALKSSLLNITNKKASPPLNVQPATVDLEMVTFLNLVRENEMVNFQLFWESNSASLPRLSQLVRRYNVVPATSSYSERTFSVAGAVKNVRRASMTSLALRSLMILKKKGNIDQLRSFSQQE